MSQRHPRGTLFASGHTTPAGLATLITARKPVSKPVKARAAEAANPIPSRADDVYARLLQAINDGRFRPGDRVLETEIADWLMVSRTPVREALRRLESEDVLARATQGLTVAEMGEDELFELYDLREALEATAAEFAAHHATAGDLRELQRVLELEAHVPQHDNLSMAAVNRTFHITLAAASHNRYLSKTLNAMQDAFLRLPSTTFSMGGRPGKALEEHSKIVEAIAARDPAAAARHARAHIRASRRTRIRLNEQVRKLASERDGPGKPPKVWR